MKFADKIAFVFILISTFGFFFSTPRNAGPDEPVHQASSWYASTHPLGISQTSEVGGIPSILVEGSPTGHPCFAAKANISSSCQSDRATVPNTVTEYTVTNYPPAYYAIIGFAQRVFSAVAPDFIDIGGRLASMMINLSLVFLALRRSIGISSGANLVILGILTPMSLFTFAMVNPSGLEISGSILLSVLLIEQHKLSAKIKPTRVILGIFVVSILVCLSRPAAFLWVTFIAITIWLLYGKMNDPFKNASIYMNVFPGVLLGIFWNLSHKPTAGGELKLLSPAIGDYLDWFEASLRLTLTRFLQMVGNLGWLDTPTPSTFAFGYGILIVSIIAFSGSIKNIAIATGTIGLLAVVLPSILEVSNWNNWPGWWQGRYTLPIATSLAFILWTRIDRKSLAFIRLTYLTIITNILIVIIMIEKNLARYTSGNGDLKFSWTSGMGIGIGKFYLTQLCVLFLSGIFVFLIIRPSKMITILKQS